MKAFISENKLEGSSFSFVVGQLYFSASTDN